MGGELGEGHGGARVGRSGKKEGRRRDGGRNTGMVAGETTWEQKGD